MTIVTLTSDFGAHDYYAATLKGAILQRNRSLHLVDITHNIKNYDIVQAAFLFKNAWHHFPEGTIHLLSINDFSHESRAFLAIRHAGHYFVGPDNGLFWLVFGVMPEEVYELPLLPPGNFSFTNLYAQTVGHLSSRQSIAKIGTRRRDMVQRIALQPVTTATQIRGSIIYIDNYDNAIVNISRNLFEQIGGGRAFALYFKRHDPIQRLCDHYYDVPVGEILCRFNSADCLEIAVNMGRAATLLGLNVEDVVQVEFGE